MKVIIISTLLLCTLALCEVPPPYSQRGFRPSPQFISQSKHSQPQPLTALDVPINSKLTIEQLIALTERLQSSRGRIINRPQRIEVSSYLPPPREQQQNNLQINHLRPPPQNQYGPPQPSSFRPQVLPNKLQNPQTHYVPPQNLNVASSSQQNIPQTSYGVPSNQIPPSTNYGVPDFRNVETFGEQQSDEAILRQNLLNDLKKQHAPYKAPTGFKPQQPQITISQQYLPAAGGGNVGQQPQSGGFGGNQPSQTEATVNNNVGQNYLPPQTTPRAIFTSRATTLRPSTVATTVATAVDGSTNYDYDYDVQQTTESPLNQEGSEAGPNVSISTAVAGANGFFYLQQPDGRLQKVVLQKMQEPNSKPEEYVANYYFQNIQALPNTVYAPLVSLGTYAQK